MYLSDPFILQNVKKAPQLWECAIFGPKMAHLSWTKFFWCKSLLLLSSTYWPFSLCKILKNSYSRSRVMSMHHFWAHNDPFAPNKFFFSKIINIILIYLLAPFIVQNFKKFFQQIQSYENARFLGPKWPIFLNENFFRTPVNEALFLSFMPVYMPKIKVTY